MNSPAQRDSARLLANRVRCTNSATFREIRQLPRPEASQRVAAILRDPQDTQPSMRIGALLSAIRSIRTAKVVKLLEAAGVGDEDRRVGRDGVHRHNALTPRQRAMIADLLAKPEHLWPGTIYSSRR